MRRRVTLAIIGALLWLAQSVVPAAAADRALVDVIGYSEDLRYFAFEEFGVQDGSGFAYANRYYIDTTTDRYLPDTPIRVRLQDETKSVNNARAEAKAQAAQVEASSGAADDPGIFAAFQPATEPQSDGTFLLYQPFAIEPYPGDKWGVSLTEKPLTPSSNCTAFDHANKGFPAKSCRFFLGIPLEPPLANTKAKVLIT